MPRSANFIFKKTIRTLVTKKPNKWWREELKNINSLFIQNRLAEKELGKTLALYCRRNYHFLIEKNDQGEYKHNRIIRALKTYKRNLKYLFTYQEYLDPNIPNTTNHVDGGVNPKLKELNRKHRGMRIDRRNKLLTILLYNLYGKSEKPYPKKSN